MSLTYRNPPVLKKTQLIGGELRENQGRPPHLAPGLGREARNGEIEVGLGEAVGESAPGGMEDVVPVAGVGGEKGDVVSGADLGPRADREVGRRGARGAHHRKAKGATEGREEGGLLEGFGRVWGGGRHGESHRLRGFSGDGRARSEIFVRFWVFLKEKARGTVSPVLRFKQPRNERKGDDGRETRRREPRGLTYLCRLAIAGVD